jgi:hypothetical protein
MVAALGPEGLTEKQSSVVVLNDDPLKNDAERLTNILDPQKERGKEHAQLPPP